MKNSKALIKLALTGVLIGLAYYAISSIANDPLEKSISFLCNSSSLLFYACTVPYVDYALYIMPGFIALLVAGILILQLLRIAYAPAIAVFSGATIAISLFLTESDGSKLVGTLFGILFGGLSFVIFGCIFNYGPGRFLKRFLLATAASVLAISIFTIVPHKIYAAKYKAEREVKWANYDIDLYAPRYPTSKFENFHWNFFNEYVEQTQPYMTLGYSHLLTANVYKKPSFFNPPANCGRLLPYKEQFGDHECVLVATTPKNRKIYSAIPNANVQHQNPSLPGYDQDSEDHFVNMGSTVISITYFAYDISLTEIIAFIDSLEPVSYNELQKFTKSETW